MEIRDSEMSLVFFILYICKMKKLMKEKNQVVPDEVLSKFISQFKTEADVEQVSEAFAVPKYWKRCLKVKWMPIWDMKRIL